MKPFSILLLGTQIATGGAQKVLLDQARWFHQNGYRVTIAFFYDRDNLLDQWKKSLPIPIYNLEAFRRSASPFQKIWLMLTGIKKLWALLRTEKFDAVITYTHDSNMIGLPLAWLAGVPARIGTHLGVIRGMSAWRVKLHALLVNIGCIQTLIAASTGTMENAIHEGVSPAKVQVIPNGVGIFETNPNHRKKVREKLNVKDDEILIVAVGRLVYEKGHEFLIEAMQKVASQSPHTKAVICGDGPRYDELASMIKNKSLENHVKLIGLWDDIPQLLSAADIFVLPSRWEGLSIALLEAMMAKLPIVATQVEGAEEALQHGSHGLVTPTQNPQALAQAILELIANPEKRTKLGLAAREQVLQNYTIEIMCQRYLTVIQRHLER